MPHQNERKKILVVEDDDSILFVVQESLEAEGHVVSTATNGKDALNLITEKDPPDLILLDMKMPIMNGWQFADQLHARHDHKIPVVVMTAAGDAAKRAKEVEADGWLGKPFSLEKLHSTVKRVAR